MSIDPPTLGIQGAMVLLRPFCRDDITDDYIGWLNDPAVVRFSNQRLAKHDRVSCLRYLSDFSGGDNLFLSIRRLDTGRAIGTMTAYVSTHHGTVDVGLMIGDKSVWGRGFGLDAWNSLTSWLLSQSTIRKLTGGTLACNMAMVRIMERTGMQLEGVRKAQEIVEGLPQDVLYFAKFRDA